MVAGEIFQIWSDSYLFVQVQADSDKMTASAAIEHKNWKNLKVIEVWCVNNQSVTHSHLDHLYGWPCHCGPANKCLYIVSLCMLQSDSANVIAMRNLDKFEFEWYGAHKNFFNIPDIIEIYAVQVHWNFKW